MDEELAEVEGNGSLPFFPASVARDQEADAFVVIVSNSLDFTWWLRNASPATQWLQVEDLLNDTEIWAVAARKETEVAIDVVIGDPALEFSRLYQLVDVSRIRDVRVSIPIRTGFLKALRLAASLQFPVRLLPGQVPPDLFPELQEALEFYLYDPQVEAPIEFFHSALASARGKSLGGLWTVLEQDPGVFQHFDEEGREKLPSAEFRGEAQDFLAWYQEQLTSRNAECVSCRWRDYCGGYFKLPDPEYSCQGVIKILDRLQIAASEMEEDLAGWETEDSEEKGRVVS